MFSKVSLIEDILNTFKDVKIVAVRSLSEVSNLQLKYKNVTFIEGEDGLNAVATIEDANILVSALVGFVGLTPTINAIKKGKDIALANKETLVVAGYIIMDLARKHNVRILPVDSEHSAMPRHRHTHPFHLPKDGDTFEPCHSDQHDCRLKYPPVHP